MPIIQVRGWCGDQTNQINGAKEEWLNDMRRAEGRRVVAASPLGFPDAAQRRRLKANLLDWAEQDIFGLATGQAVCLIDPEGDPETRFGGLPYKGWRHDFLEELIEQLDELPVEVYLGVAAYRGMSPKLECLLREFDDCTIAEFWQEGHAAPVPTIIEEVFSGRPSASIDEIESVPWLDVTRRVRAYRLFAAGALVREVRALGLVLPTRGDTGREWRRQARSRPPEVWDAAAVALARGWELQRFGRGGDPPLDQASVEQLRLHILARAIRVLD